MQNKTEVINMALQRCGAAGINAAFQDTQEAAIAEASYEHCRTYVLSQYKWSFAMKYAPLALVVDAPEFGYANAFALPGDCVQVIDVHPYTVDEDGVIRSEGMFRHRPAKWEIVGRHVYSNFPLLAMRYVSNDDVSMPEAFANALAWRLAFEIAPYMQQGTNAAGQYYQLYEQALDQAKVDNDAQQNGERTPEWRKSPHIHRQFSSIEERW